MEFLLYKEQWNGTFTLQQRTMEWNFNFTTKNNKMEL